MIAPKVPVGTILPYFFDSKKVTFKIKIPRGWKKIDPIAGVGYRIEPNGLDRAVAKAKQSKKKKK